MEVLNVWIAHNGPPIQDAIRVRFNLSGYDLDLVEQALRKPHVVERRLFKVIRSPVRKKILHDILNVLDELE